MSSEELGNFERLITYLSLFAALYSAIYALSEENLKIFSNNIKDREQELKVISFEGRKKRYKRTLRIFIFLKWLNFCVKWASIFIFNLLIALLCVGNTIFQNITVWGVVYTGLFAILILFCSSIVMWVLVAVMKGSYGDYLKDASSEIINTEKALSQAS